MRQHICSALLQIMLRLLRASARNHFKYTSIKLAQNQLSRGASDSERSKEH